MIRPNAKTRIALVALAATIAILLSAGPVLAGQATLVTFTGGPVVPGGHYRLVVHSGGSTTLSDGTHRTFTLPASVLRTVKRQLKAARFATLKQVYRHTGHPVVGVYPDVVTYHGRKVTVKPGAKPPARLARLIGDLRAIVAKAE